MTQMDSIPYLLRGVMPIATHSSLLVSSSKYLNHGRMRDWIAMIGLREVIDRDTSQASAYWTGGASTPPIVSESCWTGIITPPNCGPPPP